MDDRNLGLTEAFEQNLDKAFVLPPKKAVLGTPGAAAVKKPWKKMNIWLKTLMVFGIVLVSIIAMLLGGIFFIVRGPYPGARDVFVVTVMETSAAKFMATLFLDQQTVDQIIADNSVKVIDIPSDESLIQIPHPEQADPDQKDLEIIDITKSNFKGKLMIIKDPSRVSLATAPQLGTVGMRTDAIIKNEGAVAGINAGGFVDIDGKGNGGQPIGIVISGGKLLNGDLDTVYSVIGFDQNHKLILGKFTARQALEKGIRDAVSFDPFLIVNGKANAVGGAGGGLNPRTVIGQRADGSVLMLVIDGRQVTSLGANYQDCIDIMLEYGAVNAANLDGGSSSVMVYEGEIINTCSSLYGPRETPTAFIVK